MSPSRSPTPTLVNHLSNSLIHSSSTTPSRHPHSSSSSAPPHPSSFDETSPSRPYLAAERRSRPPPLTIASPRPSAHGPPLQATSLSSTTATAPPPLSGPTSVETELPDSIATTTTSTIANPSSSSKRKAVVLTTAAPVETPTTANSTTTLTDNNSYYDYCSPTMAKRIRRRSPSPRRPPSTTPTAATTTTTTATFFSSSTSPSSFRRRRRDGSSSGAMGGGGDCSSPSSSSQDGMMADTDSDVGKTEDTADHLSLSNVTSSADGGGVRQSQAATTHATTATPSTTSSSLSLAGGGGPPAMEGATTTAPPKKKRTRTLTTPHQSAVLHALLAQSRFPTTAMREEVGRSIGLSARKVQNQRQKARRPRSQGDTAAGAVAARPPQYGPFPTAPDPGLIQTQTSRGFHDSVEHSTQSRASVQELGSRETPPRLLGPGMPGVGAAPYPPQPYRLQGHGIPVSAPPIESSHFPPGPSVHRPVSPLIYGSPRMYPPPGPRPATSHPGNAWRERDPSRTLPPLIPSRPPSSSNHASRLPPPHGSLPHRHAPSPRLPHPSGAAPYPHPRTSSHSQHLPSPLLPPYDPITRSTSPEPRFAHHPPEASARSHHSTAIPPPFTLQPPPQWDDTSFSPFPRPTSSGWSRPRSRTMGGRSSSPVAQTYRTGPGERMGSGSSISDFSPSDGRHPHSHRHGPPPTPTSHYGVSAVTTSPQSLASSSSGPPSRSGRYDPVRATFVPYSSPSPTVSPSHAVGHGHSAASGVGRSRGGNGDDNQKSHHHER